MAYFEDQQELTWFENLVRERIRQRDPDFAQPHYNEFAKWLDGYKLFELYCACFSTEPDMLSQWNAYADYGRGFAIGFNRERLELLSEEARKPREKDGVRQPGIRIALRDVNYDIREHEAAAEQLVESYDRFLRGNLDNQIKREWGNFFGQTNVWFHAPGFKNPLFETEKEVRLIRRAGGGEKFRMRGSQVVPYVELPFDRAANGLPWINEIWFGPRVPSYPKNRDAIGLMLTDLGYEDVGKIIFEPSRLRLI
ncbi:MAG: DUF2971 domain-containing protein [Planctomycetaceae bacterium]